MSLVPDDQIRRAVPERERERLDQNISPVDVRMSDQHRHRDRWVTVECRARARTERGTWRSEGGAYDGGWSPGGRGEGARDILSDATSISSRLG